VRVNGCDKRTVSAWLLFGTDDDRYYYLIVVITLRDVRTVDDNGQRGIRVCFVLSSLTWKCETSIDTVRVSEEKSSGARGVRQ